MASLPRSLCLCWCFSLRFLLQSVSGQGTVPGWLMSPTERIRMLQNQPIQTIPKAELLACSERHVWNLIARGELSAYRLGAITRLRIEDVEAFVDSNRREPA